MIISFKDSLNIYSYIHYARMALCIKVLIKKTKIFVLPISQNHKNDAGPSGLKVWGIGLDDLDAKTMGSNPI
jgi:hypothetical protein